MEIKKFNSNQLLLDSLIGKSKEEANNMANFNGFSTRVTREDGENYLVTFDLLRFDRINLELDNKKVTKASIG